MSVHIRLAVGLLSVYLLWCKRWLAVCLLAVLLCLSVLLRLSVMLRLIIRLLAELLWLAIHLLLAIGLWAILLWLSVLLCLIIRLLIKRLRLSKLLRLLVKLLLTVGLNILLKLIYLTGIVLRVVLRHIICLWILFVPHKKPPVYQNKKLIRL